MNAVVADKDQLIRQLQSEQRRMRDSAKDMVSSNRQLREEVIAVHAHFAQWYVFAI